MQSTLQHHSQSPVSIMCTDLHFLWDSCLRHGAELFLFMLQRRRTAEDEINMRSIFEEGDLISVRLYLVTV